MPATRSADERALLKAIIRESGVSDATILVEVRRQRLTSAIFRRVVRQRRHLAGALVDDLAARHCAPEVAAHFLSENTDMPLAAFERLLGFCASRLPADHARLAGVLTEVCRKESRTKLRAVVMAGVRPTAKCMQELRGHLGADGFNDCVADLFARDHVYSESDQWDMATRAAYNASLLNFKFILMRLGLTLEGAPLDRRVALVNAALRSWYGAEESVLKYLMSVGVMNDVPLEWLDMSFYDSEGRRERLLAEWYLTGAKQQLSIGRVPDEVPGWRAPEPLPRAFGRLLPHLPAGASVAVLDLRDYRTEERKLRLVVKAWMRTPIARILAGRAVGRGLRALLPACSWSPSRHRQSTAAVRATLRTLLVLHGARRPSARADLAVLPWHLLLRLFECIHTQHDPIEVVYD